jgi:hypothetical protein
MTEPHKMTHPDITEVQITEDQSMHAPWRDCLDCGVPTYRIGEDYYVRPDVWPIGRDDGMLCIGCLEQRIGRRLVAADFEEGMPHHDPRTSSERLRARLGKPDAPDS